MGTKAPIGTYYTVTQTAPMGARQINHNLYVGQSDLASMQEAVDFAADAGGGFAIIIPQGYAGSDSIAALVNGSPTTYLSDQRVAPSQEYFWDGTHYIHSDFVQLSGFVAKGMPTPPPASITLGFDPLGTGGAGSGNIDVAPAAGGATPAINIRYREQDGTPLDWLRLDVEPTELFPRVLIPATTYLLNNPGGMNLWLGGPYADGGKGLSVIADPTGNAIDFQGVTVGGDFDQDISLNRLGGNIQLGMNASVDEDGNLDAVSLNVDTLALAGDLEVGGNINGHLKIRAYGFSPIDLSASHMTIGVSASGTIPITSFLNTSAPVNQRMWSIAALPTQLIFTADQDNGVNFNWMEVDRAGTDVTLVNIIPPVTIEGVLTLSGDPTQPLEAATKGYVDDAIADSGNFVYPGAGVTVSTGSAWGTPINPATLAHYPGAGVPVSTGTAWGTSIDPNTLVKLNVTNTGTLSISGMLNVGAIIGAPGWNIGSYAPSGPSNIGSQSGNDTWAFLTTSSAGAPGFIWDANHDMTFATSTQNSGVGYLPLLTLTHGTGDAIAKGNVKGKTIAATGSDPQLSAFNMDYSPTGDGAAWGRLLAVSAAASSVAPDMVFICLSGDGSSYNEFMRHRIATNSTDIAGNLGVQGDRIAINGGQLFLGNITLAGRDFLFPSIAGDGTHIFVNALASGYVGLNIHNGQGGVVFGNGAGGVVATMGPDGHLSCAMLDVSGAKNFVIPHPLDASKKLTHSCIEGPEVAVFYRGTAQCVDGMADVTLPDYFEKLTAKEGRTVLLTQIEDGAEFALLSASHVIAGKFRIRSSEENAAVYWEVKAIRAGATIEVVSDREEQAA